MSDDQIADDQTSDDQTSPELLRLTALAHYHLDQNTPLHGPAFARLTAMAARLFQVPTVLISFLDDGWQWWGASCGLELLELPERGIEATQGLCRLVVQSGQPLFVADTAHHGTSRHHRLLQSKLAGGNAVRFYAGVPLTTPQGHPIGTLCLLGSAPHPSLTPAEQQTLSDLAALVMDGLERRRLTIASEGQSGAHDLLSDGLREALSRSETLQAISELSDLGLSLDELLLRAVALCASVCDVDLGSLVAIHEDRAFIFPAWHSPRAERLAALVSRGIKRGECQHLWTAASSGACLPMFVNDYVAHPGAHLALTQAGVRAQAHVPVGQRGGVHFLMVLSRLNGDRPWRPDQRQLIAAVARMMQGLSRQRRQQEALASSTAQLELALGAAPLIMFGTDRGGVFRLSRGSGLEALKMETTLGRSVDDVFAPFPQVVRNVHRAIGGENFDDVVSVGELTYDVRYAQVKDIQGHPAGMLGVGYDVTARVKSEAQAIRARREAEGLLHLAQTVTGDVLTPEVAQTALDALLQVLAGGWLVLWELRGDHYFPVSQRGEGHGLWPTALAELCRLHEQGVPLRYVAQLFGALDGNVYLTDTELPLQDQRAGVRGLAGLPLVRQHGRCLVALVASSPRPWNPAERELLETAASIFAVGLIRIPSNPL